MASVPFDGAFLAKEDLSIKKDEITNRAGGHLHK
jgi:hypothetical protein